MGRLGKSLRSILCTKQQVWPIVSSQQDAKAPVQPVALSMPVNVPQNVPNSVHNVSHISHVMKTSVENMAPLMPVNVPQNAPAPVHNIFHISQMVKTPMQPLVRPQPVNFLRNVPSPVYHAFKQPQFIPVPKAIPVHEETAMEVDDPDVIMKDLSRPKRNLRRPFLHRPSFPLLPAPCVVVPIPIMQVDLPTPEDHGGSDKMDVDTKPLEPRNIVNDDQEPSEELRHRRTPSGNQLVVDLADELEALSLHEYASKNLSMPAGADMDALCDKLDSISLTDEMDRLTELMAKLTISDDEEDETTLVVSQTSTSSDMVAKPSGLPCSQVSPWGSYNSLAILIPPAYPLILPLPAYTPSKSYLGLFAQCPVIPSFLKSSIWMKWRKPTSRKSTKHRVSFAKTD